MAGKETPLMRQYWEIKNQHQDKVLLFRMGDFFEMFHDDARTAAPIINIALTARNKKAKDDTAMCGVPHHSISTPIAKLLAAGHKVAICDQLENPAEAKGLVKRGVTRVLTPGMVYDPDTLEELTANYVAAFDEGHLALIDPSTGASLLYRVSSVSELNELLQLLQPREVVLTSEQRSHSQVVLPDHTHLSVFDQADEDWPSDFAGAPMVAKRLLTYAVSLQGTEVLSSLRAFSEKNLSERMSLRSTTMTHLEIFESYRGQKEGSLFHAINRTRSSSGARLLKSWLQFPLSSVESIQSRQKEVRYWQNDLAKLKRVRECLGKMGDIERRLTKIAYSTCHPRDLLALSNSLQMGLALTELVSDKKDLNFESAVFVSSLVDRAVADDPPAMMKKGGFIRKGYHPELDELIDTAENSAQLVLELEAREKESTAIPSLKVRYNNVFGYYIEVTNAHKDKVPSHYSRKQTLTNAERYITEELDALEVKVLSAKSKRLQLEDELFAEVKREVLKRNRELLKLAEFWSEVDIHSSMAWLAMEQNYVLPDVIAEGDLKLEASRHPVVEQEVHKDFVPNDISMKAGDCILLTGPNMAGKSTIMRQAAVIVLLAQVGAVVPCRKAMVPIFDQIFTRIGASDFLSEGLSTFMVEMTETAELLKAATDKSLVILDEIGRGTSTYDGMSLAQAILEHLVAGKGMRTFFATHYHELVSLGENYSNVHNAHMSIEESGDQIHFLYALKAGPANKSYGIHVAELAGLPPEIVKRARQLLKDFEKQSMAAPDSQLSLELPVEAAESALENDLRTLNLNELTPIDALNKLNKWRQSLT